MNKQGANVQNGTVVHTLRSFSINPSSHPPTRVIIFPLSSSLFVSPPPSYTLFLSRCAGERSRRGLLTHRPLLPPRTSSWVSYYPTARHDEEAKLTFVTKSRFPLPFRDLIAFLPGPSEDPALSDRPLLPRAAAGCGERSEVPVSIPHTFFDFGPSSKREAIDEKSDSISAIHECSYKNTYFSLVLYSI